MYFLKPQENDYEIELVVISMLSCQNIWKAIICIDFIHVWPLELKNKQVSGFRKIFEDICVFLP